MLHLIKAQVRCNNHWAFRPISAVDDLEHLLHFVVGFAFGSEIVNDKQPCRIHLADKQPLFLGFLKGDWKTDGVEDVNCAVIVRGNIKPAKLPIAFTVPTTAPQPQFAYWS